MPKRAAKTARDPRGAWHTFLSIKEKAFFPVIDPSWTFSKETVQSGQAALVTIVPSHYSVNIDTF